ncbi:MAG TPA: hypothetical protein PKM70_06470 [Clostridia bacterium]|nr:hypothetical protein [Clostridia bacterium]
MRNRKYLLSFLFLISVIIAVFFPHRYGYSMNKTVANKYYRKYISLIDETKDVYMVGCIGEYEYMYFKTTDNKIYCGEKYYDSDEYYLYVNECLYVYSNGVLEVRSGNYEFKHNEIFNELNKKKEQISNSSEYRAYRVTWNNGLPFFAKEGDILLDFNFRTARIYTCQTQRRIMISTLKIILKMSSLG